MLLIWLGLFVVNAQKYKSITIGNQVWMAENLKTPVEGSEIYHHNVSYEQKYGRLYTWEASLSVCPQNWHLPTSDEWEELIKYLGGADIAGKRLKTGGDSGFNAVLGGFSNTGGFQLFNFYGTYWSSTEFSNTHAWYVYFTSSQDIVTKTYFTKKYELSVRCIHD